jgi:arylsulfatase A-like enzyme
VSPALVHVTDLFPTLAEIAQVELNDTLALDGVSILPAIRDPDAPIDRTTLYSDRFRPLGPPPWDEIDRRAIRDDRWKLLVDELTGTKEFYDLADRAFDEGEALDLDHLTPEQAEALGNLETELMSYREQVVFDERYLPDR